MDQTQIDEAAQGYVDRLVSDGTSADLVVAELVQMDMNTRSKICASMYIDCYRQPDQQGCFSQQGYVCQKAKSQAASQATLGASLGTGGAMLLGGLVVAGLFWAIK